MAENPTPKDPEALETALEDAADGLHEVQVRIGVKQFTETKLRAALAALTAANNQYRLAVQGTRAANRAHTIATSNAKGFVARARDRLKNFLGDKPSANWVPVGFPANSLAVPESSDELLPLLNSLKQHFTANATHEDATPGVNITAARAEELRESLSGARSGVGAAEQAQSERRAALEDAVREARFCHGGLREECKRLIPLDSGDWYTIGMVPPASNGAPAAPRNQRATALGSGRVRFQCDRVSRADRYRLSILVVGVHPDFTELDRTEVPDVLMEDLPPGATVKFKWRAGNNADYGQFSAEAEVVVS